MKMNHITSLENVTLGEAEPVTDVRRPKTKARNRQPWAGYSNGVDVGGTEGSGVGISRETSTGGQQNPTDSTSPIKSDKAGLVCGGVGVRGSSDDPSESITDGEPSAGTCSCVRERRNSRVMARASEIETPTKAKTFNPSIHIGSPASPVVVSNRVNCFKSCR